MDNTEQPKKKRIWLKVAVVVIALIVIGKACGGDQPGTPASGAEEPAKDQGEQPTTGNAGSARLLFSITPGMTPEQVVQKVGQPHEVRQDGYGSGQWWIYGPDSNQCVTFLQGKVLVVDYDIVGSNRQQCEIMGYAKGDDRLLKLTPGMTHEMVLRQLGQPQEVRKELGSGEWWIYGPGGNQAVVFLKGRVTDINYDIIRTNQMMQGVQ